MDMTGARKGRSFGIADEERLARGFETGHCLVAAEQLDALEQPGADVRARDRDTDRLEGVAGLEAVALGKPAKRGFDVLGVKRLDRLQCLGSLPDDRSAAVELG